MCLMGKLEMLIDWNIFIIHMRARVSTFVVSRREEKPSKTDLDSSRNDNETHEELGSSTMKCRSNTD